MQVKAQEKPKTSTFNPEKMDLLLLVATYKGAFILYNEGDRKKWHINGPYYLGSIVHHMVLDPRDRKTILMAACAGHLGSTVFRSTDFGKTWLEADQPPAFDKVAVGETGRRVNHTFWLTPCGEDEADCWYAGTSPQGLFRTEDGGKTWKGVDGFNKHPMVNKWTGGDQDGTPDGPKLHSILVDPRDSNHLYLSMSGGGTFESLDKGQSWNPLNKGVAADFLPVENPEYGHDPHCVVYHPQNPDLLYQQNHCGIYKLQRPAEIWERIGDNMPKDVGDIGFPIGVHPQDQNMIWVFPMDGTDVWSRTSPDGIPAVYKSNDGGNSWEPKNNGLPKNNAWLTVFRQAMAVDSLDPAGVYIGSTSGHIWASDDEGESWFEIAAHLPKIYALEIGIINK